MTLDKSKHKQWLVGIITGAVAGVLAGVMLYYFFEYRKEKISEDILITSMENADKLIEQNMYEDALAIYNDILVLAADVLFCDRGDIDGPVQPHDHAITQFLIEIFPRLMALERGQKET